MTITHAFTSGKTDATDATLVRPSNWNADHVIGDGSSTLNALAGVMSVSTAFSVGTTNPITCGTIELGAASDTTISRSGAGAIQVEGVQVILQNSSPTFATVTTTGNIELGNASDTTISRSGAGAVQVEGVQVILQNSSPTFGTVTTTGNIELGNASDTTLARSSGGVVTIEGNKIATQTTGTWSPTLLGSGTPGTTTYTTRDGDYIRVGDLVRATFALNPASISGGTGDINISLPFTINGSQRNGHGVVLLNGVSMGTNVEIITFGSGSGTVVRFFEMVADGTSWGFLGISAVGAGDSIIGSYTYWAA